MGALYREGGGNLHRGSWDPLGCAAAPDNAGMSAATPGGCFGVGRGKSLLPRVVLKK